MRLIGVARTVLRSGQMTEIKGKVETPGELDAWSMGRGAEEGE